MKLINKDHPGFYGYTFCKEDGYITAHSCNPIEDYFEISCIDSMQSLTTGDIHNVELSKKQVRYYYTYTAADICKKYNRIMEVVYKGVKYVVTDLLRPVDPCTLSSFLYSVTGDNNVMDSLLNIPNFSWSDFRNISKTEVPFLEHVYGNYYRVISFSDALEYPQNFVKHQLNQHKDEKSLTELAIKTINKNIYLGLRGSRLVEHITRKIREEHLRSLNAA